MFMRRAIKRWMKLIKTPNSSWESNPVPTRKCRWSILLDRSRRRHQCSWWGNFCAYIYNPGFIIFNVTLSNDNYNCEYLVIACELHDSTEKRCKLCHNEVAGEIHINNKNNNKNKTPD